MSSRLPSRLAWAVPLALTGFAANSLLARQALGANLLDPASFTAVRLASGAAMLALLVSVRGGGRVGRGAARAGSWTSAAALGAYAAAFSFSYVQIGAAIGALVLFATVQVSMIGWGLWRGERPGAVEWVGLAMALAGLGWLTAPARGPDLAGILLMVIAGATWAVYSLRGRAASRPIDETAANFARSVPLVLPILAVPALWGGHVSAAGVWLAIVSGAITSGLAYSLWYAALPLLTATQAALAQLAVPALAALGAVVILGEPLTLRMLLAASLIFAGVLVAFFGRRALAAR
jgi:drug/metabolite transporter (DMT)-like permease